MELNQRRIAPIRFARNPGGMGFLKLLTLFTCTLFAVEAHADPRLDFVHQVMRLEMDYSDQFMDRDNRGHKGRWPDERSANAERMKNISRKYLLDNDVDPTMSMDAYKVDAYEILGQSGPLVFVRRREESCMKKPGCPDDTVLILNVVAESTRYVLIPANHDPPSMRYWWAQSEDHFDLPDPRYCATNPAPLDARMRATANTLMTMMIDGNEGRFTRKQRVDLLGRAFFREAGIEPALTKLNNEQFGSYTIVGIYGPFVDVKLNRAPLCPDCAAQFLRLKTIIEDGAVRIQPAGMSPWDPSYVTYWWSRSYDHHVPLCSTTQSKSF